jgi:hypothetical protein
MEIIWNRENCHNGVVVLGPNGKQSVCFKAWPKANRIRLLTLYTVWVQTHRNHPSLALVQTYKNFACTTVHVAILVTYNIGNPFLGL